MPLTTKILISNDEANKSFTEQLSSTIDREYLHCSDPEWIIFLKDHEKLIKEHSEWRSLDKETLYKYRFRLREYLEDENISVDLLQSTKIVNRFYNGYDFNIDIEGLYIPNRSYIDNLRDTYATNKTLLKQL